jgi:hypothetical protein
MCFYSYSRNILALACKKNQLKYVLIVVEDGGRNTAILLSEPSTESLAKSSKKKN